MLKRIHVNMHIIRRNRQETLRDPPLSVKTSRSNLKADSIEILGPSRLIYSPDRPLSCGARVWIETDAPLRLSANGDRTELP